MSRPPRRLAKRAGTLSLLIAMLATFLSVAAASPAAAVEQSVAGTVMRAGAPLDGEVEFYDSDGDYITWAPLDGNGRFQTSLADGDYWVSLYDKDTGDSQWWGGSQYRTSSQPINVTGAPLDLGTIDWVEPGSVTATLRGSAGQALDGELTIYADNGYGYGPIAEEYANDGDFSFNLAPGTYKFRFYSYDYGTSKFYPNANSLSAAQEVAIGRGANVLNAVTMAEPATVLGIVRNASGTPLRDIYVELRDSENNQVDWDYTDRNGAYSFRRVSEGTGYTVVAQDHNNSEYDDVTSAAFNVPATGTVTAPSVSMVRRSTISGKLTNASGAALSHVYVTAFDESFGYVGGSRTDANGNYTIVGLQPGTYRLRFVDQLDDYLSEWFDNKPDFESATPISVGTRQDVGGQNAQLAPDTTPVTGIDLQGTVRGTGGVPLVGVDACVASVGPGGDRCVKTSRAGHYVFTDLSAGNYQLQFGDWDEDGDRLPYRSEWYDDARTREHSKVITVAVDTPGVPRDATLTQYGALEGNVKDMAGVALSDAEIQAFDIDGEEVDSVNTDSTGEFELQLPPGPYRLRIEGWREQSVGPSESFVREWFDNVRTMDKARSLAVAPGVRTKGLAVKLTKNLEPYAAPTIVGTPVVGKALKATTGEFNLMAENTYTYEWLRGATVVDTAATYVPKLADAGQGLQLRVTATHHNLVGTATSRTSSAVKSVSATSITGTSPTKATVKLTVAVKVFGVANPGGTLTIKRKSTTVKSRVAVVNGKAVVTLTKQPKGSQKYQAFYSGTGKVLGSVSGVRSVTVK